LSTKDLNRLISDTASLTDNSNLWFT
jgi:hypothetical protein